MQDAGLTHGGFYKHFGSKDKLLVESLSEAFREIADTLVHVAKQSPPGAAWKGIVKAYLPVTTMLCALSIKPLEGSRLRFVGRGLWEFNRFGAGRHCKQGSCAKSLVIDARQCTAPGVQPGDGTPRLFFFTSADTLAPIHAAASAAPAASF